VVLLEVRPGKVVVAGLVWMSRAVGFPWTTPASSYFCQDRDLEERRGNFLEAREKIRQKKGSSSLSELREEVRQLRLELESVKMELETARVRGFGGDSSRGGPSMDAK